MDNSMSAVSLWKTVWITIRHDFLFSENNGLYGASQRLPGVIKFAQGKDYGTIIQWDELRGDDILYVHNLTLRNNDARYVVSTPNYFVASRFLESENEITLVATNNSKTHKQLELDVITELIDYKFKNEEGYIDIVYQLDFCGDLLCVASLNLLLEKREI